MAEPEAAAVVTSVAPSTSSAGAISTISPSAVAALEKNPGLEALLQAAQYLEENGATSTGAEVDIQTSGPRRKASRQRAKKPSPYSRTTHNLLEKNRRAQLRDCLEVLRQHVPFPDKLTTLALLQSARKYIEALKEKEKEENRLINELQKNQTILLTRLAELGANGKLMPEVVSALTSGPSPNIVDSTSLGANNSNADEQENKSVQTSTSPVTTPTISVSKGEEETTIVDILHDSDDNSSTTSGSDGGCTSTSHKVNQEIPTMS